MRAGYNDYPEYHTSLDDMTLISPAGLAGGFTAIRKCIELLEHNRVYKVTMLCEPHLGGRGFYPTLGSRGVARSVRSVTNVLAYADGTRDLIAVATHIGVSAEEVVEIAERLSEAGLLEIVDS